MYTNKKIRIIVFTLVYKNVQAASKKLNYFKNTENMRLYIFNKLTL